MVQYRVVAFTLTANHHSKAVIEIHKTIGALFHGARGDQHSKQQRGHWASITLHATNGNQGHL